MQTPAELRLPSKFTEFREIQKEFLGIFSATDNNIMAELPMGTGKTLIALAAQRLFGQPAVFITPTKNLQDQLVTDADYAKLVKGRGNYSCLIYQGETAESCTHSKAFPCKRVDECPYKLDRAAAEASDFAVLNSSYYLMSSRFVETFTGKNRPLLIVDEADIFHNTLIDFIQIKITARLIRDLSQLNVNPPPTSLKKEDIDPWLDIVHSRLTNVVYEEETQDLDAKQIQRVTNLFYSIDYYRKNKVTKWFVQKTTGLFTTGLEFELKPVIVGDLAKKLVWDNHERVLLMSGTILNPDTIKRDLGIEADFHQFDCPFPKENRNIFVLPGAITLNQANINNSIEGICEQIVSITEAYPNSKILINTQSYKIAQMIKTHINPEASSRFLIQEDTKGREDHLENFRNSERPLVLLSPSFSRGLDLYEPEFDCVIILKIPFPYLGDEQISQRMKLPDGNAWYKRETAATLMQSSFRALRSDDKKCDVWIIDGNWKQVYPLFPKWYKDSIVEYDGRDIQAYGVE